MNSRPVKAAGEISSDRVARDDDGETGKWAEGSEELPREASGLLGNGIGAGNPIQGLRNKSKRRWRQRCSECGGRLGRGEAAWASEKNGWKKRKADSAYGLIASSKIGLSSLI